jgi:hypothetical protein
MQQILPNFHISLALENLKMSQSFSQSAKTDPGPLIEMAKIMNFYVFTNKII